MPITSGNNNLRHTRLENLRDYEHAAYVFRPNQYANSPRFKFLFHVHFTLNTGQIPILKNIFGTDWPTISLLVKNVTLPKFKVKTDTLNQYNRKRVVQSKIEYEPVKVDFHDDNNDLVRKMWYHYYTYYYKDATHRYGNANNTNGTNGESNSISNGFDYNNRDIYDGNLLETDWGYSGESYKDGILLGSKPLFFRDVRVYGFGQSRFAEYVLINPIISAWDHDTYDYSEDGGIMTNSVTFEYETVKYYSGKIGKNGLPNPVLGFPDTPFNYDPGPSPLTSTNWEEELTPGRRQDLQTGSLSSTVGAPEQAQAARSTGVRTAQSGPGPVPYATSPAIPPPIENNPVNVFQSPPIPGSSILAVNTPLPAAPGTNILSSGTSAIPTGQNRAQPNQQGNNTFNFPVAPRGR